MATIKRLPQRRSDRLRRFTRAHTPFQPPAFTIWHGLLSAFLLSLLLAQQRAPGLLSDVSGLQVGDWQAGILARQTVILLNLYALLAVRGLHPLMYVAMPTTVIGLCLRLGEIRMTHEPLSLGFTLSLVALALFAVRVITRQPDPVRAGGTP